MNWSFAWRMAARERRAAGKRLALHTTAVAIGVAGLVAINAFRANVADSVAHQARALLGSDLELATNRPFPDSVASILDSAAATGIPISRQIRFASMALAPATGNTRLVQVRAVDGGFPYYGVVETDPPGRWGRLGARETLVDPAVLIQLGIRVGDRLRVGDIAFTVTGAVTNYPGRISLQTAIGPRVYIAMGSLEATGLLRPGSRAFYEAHLAVPDADVLRRFLTRHGATFDRANINRTTVDETEDDLTSAFDTLARFLGLVGLAAVLLGGLGVGSAVHAFVRSRLQTASVLRCLGADQATVFAVYLVLAAAMGAIGGTGGALLGVGLQQLLPHVLGDFLPVDVEAVVQIPAVLSGFAVGVLVAFLFALHPLLGIHDVTPLQALRRDYDAPRRRWDVRRLTALAALAVAVVYASLREAPEPWIGAGFAGAVAATAFGLWLTAWALIRAARRLLPDRARYEVRQGLANLFRPRNQTVAVTLALGFGVFQLAGLYVVQRNVVDQFSINARPDRPNLVLFDVQPDQREPVRRLLNTFAMPTLQTTPIVPARIAALNGEAVDAILAAPGAYRYERWAFRHEYRNTYRDTLVASERMVAGAWWDAAHPSHDSVPWISMEEDVARSLNLTVGDRVTWNVQGVPVETRVTSLRRVDWMRFEPNFFVVFAPGVLEHAPQTSVVLTRQDDPTTRATFQRDLVTAFPNVAAVDTTLVQRTLQTVIAKVTLAIRFMALFSIAAGLVILVGALTSSRFQRTRESVLLKTLGATSRQVRAVLLTEYFVLGALAGLAGLLLAAAGGWAAVHWVFELPFVLPLRALVAFWLGNAMLTMVVGALAGRDALRKQPLEVLRELGD